jgi:hypothetical protein
MQDSYRLFDGYPQLKTYVSTTPVSGFLDTTHQVYQVSRYLHMMVMQSLEVRQGFGGGDDMLGPVDVDNLAGQLVVSQAPLHALHHRILDHRLTSCHMQCCGSGMFIPYPTFFHPGSRIRLFSIPDPNCLHPGSRILIKKCKYFNPKKTKKWFLSSKKYEPGCSSGIPDPGVK